MAETIVTLSSEDAELLKSFNKWLQNQKKVDEGNAKNEKSSKRAADQAVKDAERQAREGKKLTDYLVREHQKLLDEKERESRKAAQESEALARRTAFKEAQEAAKAADKEIAALERVAAKKRKDAEQAALLARESAHAELDARLARQNGLAAGIASYVSLNSLISTYNSNLQDQVSLQNESLAKAKEIAASQSGALKNLSGLSSKQKAEALKAAKDLQREIGFPQLAPLNDAIGAGFGASGDLGLAVSATRAAALLNKNNPQDVPKVVAGLLAAARGTGVRDARSNMSFLLQAGSQALVYDPTQLANTLAPTVSSGVATVPNQDRQEASREVAALFSEFNQFATDTTGLSTHTNTNVFLAELRDFFTNAAVEAQKLRDQIAPLERKLKVTEEERVAIATADQEVSSLEKKYSKFAAAPDSELKTKAKLRLERAIARRDRLMASSGLDVEDFSKLEQLQKDLGALDQLKDPGTILGRVRSIKEDTERYRLFFQKGFGEVAFKGAFRQLFTDDKFLEKVESNKEALNFDTEEFNREVAEVETATPELRIANENAAVEARAESDLGSAATSTIANMRREFESAMKKSRRGGIEGLIDSYLAAPESYAAPKDDDDVYGHVGYFTMRLSNQLGRAKGIATGPASQEKIDRLELAIGKIQEMGANFAAPESTESRFRELEMMDKQNALLKENNEVLKSIDSKMNNNEANPNAIRAQESAGKG